MWQGFWICGEIQQTSSVCLRNIHGDMLIFITRHDMLTLRSREWLNDQISNFYVRLVQARELECIFMTNDVSPRVWVTNSYFMTKLMHTNYKYANVESWLKNVNVS